MKTQPKWIECYWVSYFRKPWKAILFSDNLSNAQTTMSLAAMWEEPPAVAASVVMFRCALWSCVTTEAGREGGSERYSTAVSLRPGVSLTGPISLLRCSLIAISWQSWYRTGHENLFYPPLTNSLSLSQGFPQRQVRHQYTLSIYLPRWKKLFPKQLALHDLPAWLRSLYSD